MVGLIPELLLIASMRHDMIHHASEHAPSLLGALDTVGMAQQVSRAVFLPFAVIAPLN